MMGGCSFTRDYFSDTKAKELEAKIASFEQLVADSQEIEAVLDSVYTITTAKVMGVPVKLYSTKYFFEVCGNLYSGTYIPTSERAEAFIKVRYLPQDPAVSSFNPKAELYNLKESRESNMSLYLGIAFLLFGSSMVYINFKAIRQRKREEEEATLQSIKEFNESKGFTPDK